MTEEIEEYHSSDDEDYVPEDIVEDLDCSSGDEVDEVKETDVLLTTKRKRAGKDAAFPSPPKPIAAETSDDRDDAEAAFLALMTAKDPILGKTRIEIETDALPSLSCGFPEAIASTSSSDTKPEDKPEITDGETTVVTEVFDFAGDEVKVQRVVSTEEAKEIEAREKRKENEKSKKPAQKMFLGDVDERLHTFRTEMTVGSTMRECIGPH
ncbi:unnamed protein product [Heligmosomoides polygyrus]|uniref:Uncharacterized protein n=1 Tax=Heligmosomoides polygyrus TaxID=6339 RepID=A0A183FUM4_HELPZ|nr:unnamed protein product [Heligmosomoides polygyrus]